MVDHELDDLRREFLAEAEAKVLEMQSAIDGDHSLTSLERLVYLAHQLKGSGGSYGYQTISSDAAEVEKALENIGDGTGFTAVEDRVKEHVANLRREIDERSRELAAR